MAHRADNAAGLIRCPENCFQIRVDGQVEHRALAADDEHSLIGFLTKAGEAQGRVQFRACFGIGQEALIVGFVRIERVGNDRPARRARDVNAQAVVVEDEIGLREFIHLEAGACLASIKPVSADHDQDAGGIVLCFCACLLAQEEREHAGDDPAKHEPAP